MCRDDATQDNGLRRCRGRSHQPDGTSKPFTHLIHPPDHFPYSKPLEKLSEMSETNLEDMKRMKGQLVHHIKSLQRLLDKLPKIYEHANMQEELKLCGSDSSGVELMPGHMQDDHSGRDDSGFHLISDDGEDVRDDSGVHFTSDDMLDKQDDGGQIPGSQALGSLPDVDLELLNADSSSQSICEDMGDAEDSEDESLHDPLFTSRQVEMLLHYEMFGVFGLLQFLKEIAVYEQEQERKAAAEQNGASRKRKTPHDEKQSGNASWRRLIKDIDLGLESRALFYLCSVPPILIPALIKGDLPRQMQDPEFRSKVSPHIEPRGTQGVYAVYLARQGSQNSTQGDDASAGYGPSLSELRRVIAAMKLYIDVDDPESEKMARDIDTQYGEKKGLDYRRQRRYASGVDRWDMSGHQYFIDTFEHLYLWRANQYFEEDKNDPRLFEHLLRCFVYIGLSGRVLDRVTRHWTHSGEESCMYGLFCATVSWLFGETYGVRHSSWQIFKTVANDDVGLEEILLSVITSALPADGGLNMTYCGGSLGNPNKKNQIIQARRLKDNADSIHRHGFVAQNIEDAYVKWKNILESPKLSRAAMKRKEKLQNMLEDAEKLKTQLDDSLTSMEAIEEDSLFGELEQALEDFIVEESEVC